MAARLEKAEADATDLKKRLEQAEANVNDMVERTGKSLLVENALRAKLQERTDQFDVMSIVAKRTYKEQAKPAKTIALAEAEARLQERDARIASLEASQACMHEALTKFASTSDRLVEHTRTISHDVKSMSDARLFYLSLAGSKIIQQIEHYFSFLDQDPYLKSLEDSAGWIKISELLKFDRLLQLNAHTHDIERLMSDSVVVITKPGHLKRRR